MGRQCPWAGRIIIVKMMIVLKAIYGFNTTPIKLLLMVFFTELKQKKIQSLYANTKDPKESKQS